ncbi:MAG: hypothetical protein Q7U04_04865 [Bacteriovorax sp.]|nr:hypothetical protein [Bacteriovorax sp.]
MKNNFLLINIIFFALSTQSWCSDYLIVMGAGGERKKTATTIFDETIENVSNYLKSSPRLIADIALNGGHRQTENLINNSFGSARSKNSFNKEVYQKIIKDYKLKLERNEIKPPDQILITIFDHGALNNKDINEKTHSIATSNGDAANLQNLDGNVTVSLDELESLTKLAKTKGVKIAIVDGSCHSGNTLKIADDNTCVISAAGPLHYGRVSFGQNFAAAMEKGKNLEEVFLESRAMEDQDSYPMISTTAGRSISSLFYSALTPFLYEYNKDNQYLMSYLKANYNQCLANNGYDSLNQTIDLVEQLNTVSTNILSWTIYKDKKINLDNFKQLLKKYKDVLDLTRSAIAANNSEEFKKKEKWAIRNNEFHYILNGSFSWRELITTDFNLLILQNQKHAKNETNPNKQAQLIDLESFYKQAQNKKNEILKTHPNLLNILQKNIEIEKLLTTTVSLSQKIGIEERKFYSALYKSFNENQPKQKNPCSDFKL